MEHEQNVKKGTRLYTYLFEIPTTSSYLQMKSKANKESTQTIYVQCVSLDSPSLVWYPELKQKS